MFYIYICRTNKKIYKVGQCKNIQKANQNEGKHWEKDRWRYSVKVLIYMPFGERAYVI